MWETIGKWWSDHKDEVGTWVVVMLGAVVWHVGRKLMDPQRLPLVSADPPAAPEEG